MPNASRHTRSIAGHVTLRILGAGANIVGRIITTLHHAPAKRTRIAVVHNEHVLVIQNITNFRNWTLPGGGYRRGESAATCVTRELREELGIVLSPEILVDTGEHTEHLHRFDTFVATIDDRPELHLSWEIAHAKWIPIDQLPANISPFIPSILKERALS